MNINTIPNKICERMFDKPKENLYPEKEEEKKNDSKEDKIDKNEEDKQEEVKEIVEVNGIVKGTVPYYFRKSLELGFAIPLVFYKFLIEKPATKVINLGCKISTIPDYLP